jgi:hypothetical protein
MHLHKIVLVVARSACGQGRLPHRQCADGAGRHPPPGPVAKRGRGESVPPARAARWDTFSGSRWISILARRKRLLTTVSSRSRSLFGAGQREADSAHAARTLPDRELLAELRRCRRRCEERPFVEHRKDCRSDSDPGYQCDGRCKQHVCEPLGGSTLRHIHVVLNGASRRLSGGDGSESTRWT